MLNDGDVATIPLPAGTIAMTVAITNTASASSRPNGLVYARCTSGPDCIKLAFDPGASLVDVTTGPLTGTTGTDGHFTISANSDGKLYFENRTGGARPIGASILSAA
jgi:hypothetical protein